MIQVLARRSQQVRTGHLQRDRTEQKRGIMKKILAAGLIAISMIAMTQQQASAWVQSRFSVVLNWDWQGAGNSFFWGLWRSGQIPGPPDGGGGYGPGFHGGPAMPGAPFAAPVPH